MNDRVNHHAVTTQRVHLTDLAMVTQRRSQLARGQPPSASQLLSTDRHGRLTVVVGQAPVGLSFAARRRWSAICGQTVVFLHATMLGGVFM
jgi:hypothetical protein